MRLTFRYYLLTLATRHITGLVSKFEEDRKMKNFEG